MTRTRRILTTLLALILASTVLSIVLPLLGENDAWAQSPPTDDDEGRKAALRKKIEEKIAKAREKMLREHVGLDEDRASKVGALLQELDRERFEVRKNIKAKRRELKQLVDAGGPDAEINAIIDDLTALQKQMDNFKFEADERTQPLLNASERAMLLNALPKFDRKIRRLVKKARQKARRKGKKGQGRKGRKGKKGKKNKNLRPGDFD